MTTQYKSKTPIQIRFKDLDKLGHVNNANHLTYFEIARINYFKQVIGGEINWDKEGIILAKITVDYKAPILLEDSLLVYTRCSRIGNKSFDLYYSIVKIISNTEIEVANGSSVMVCFDYLTQTSIPIPEEWKRKLIEFEK